MRIFKNFWSLINNQIWLKQPTNILLIILIVVISVFGVLFLQINKKINSNLYSTWAEVYDLRNGSYLDDQLKQIEADLSDIEHNTKWTEINTR